MSAIDVEIDSQWDDDDRFDPEPQRREPWSQTIRIEGSAAVVKATYIDYGYGYTEYQIEGTPEEIQAAVDEISRRHPQQDYGTSFEWPPRPRIPEDRLNKMLPVDLGDGRWIVQGSRRNSCD